MIEVKSLNKYFNKNKPNQIHVIDDISLKFPKTGLVCLLGPSGSGKTTLLNVISGLDRLESGNIELLDYTISHYQPNKWDMIRNLHFGYIFQNYYLLPELTVQQNLEFVLKMLNLSKSEIERRIDYALNAVGMVKYKKRRPGQLSGGQQQRIAIARALVKSPDVVVADEPTGNLDEKNTLQIMNIIKKISKECLVILVTHERRLAEFYGDRIIELLDGKVIKEFDISVKSELYKIDDNNIYLQELKKEEVDNERINVKYFYDDHKEKLDLDVIFKDDTFYIRSPKESVKIKFIDSTSEIKVIDSKKPTITYDNLEEIEYNLEKLPKGVKTNRTVIKYKDTFKMSLTHLKNLSKKQKLIYLVFFFTSILVLTAFINFFSSSDNNEYNFLTENRQIVQVKDVKEYTYDDIIELKNTFGENNVLPMGNTFHMISFDIDLFYQRKFQYFQFPNHSILPINVITSPKLLAGRLPENSYELVIDRFIADKMFIDGYVKAYGLSSYDQFVGFEYYNEIFQIRSKIVGVVDTNNPNIYMTKEGYYLSVLNSASLNYETFKTKTLNASPLTEFYSLDEFLDELESRSSSNPIKAESRPISTLNLKADEVLISKSYYEGQLNKATKFLFNNEVEFKIVGVFNDDIPNNLTTSVIIHSDALERLVFEYQIGLNELAIYTNNIPKTIKDLETRGLKARSIYKLLEDRHYAETFSLVRYTFAIMVLVASLNFMYFLMRSSLISRVYEIGVYRALGVNKANIYRLFVSEIILITLITSLAGIFATSWFIMEVNNLTPITIINYPWYISVITFGFLLTCNLVVGLIPVHMLLRSTPSQILSKYDI